MRNAENGGGSAGNNPEPEKAFYFMNERKEEPMFGRNEKVSRRQIARMLILQLFATCLFLPPFLAGGTLAQGVAALLAGAALNAVLCVILKENSSLRMPLFFLYGVYLLVLAGVLLSRMVEIVQIIFLPGSAAGIWFAILLFLAFYAYSCGIEAQLRLFDAVFWYCAAAFVFAVIVWCVYLCHVLGSGASLPFAVSAAEKSAGASGAYFLFRGVCASFLAFAPALQCVELNAYKNVRARTRRRVLLALAFAAAAAVFFFVLSYRLFGSELLRAVQFPVLTLFASLGVLQKGLSFVVGAWLVAMFGVVAAAGGFWVRLLCGRARQNRAFSAKKKKGDAAKEASLPHGSRCVAAGIVPAAFLLIVGCVFYRYDNLHTNWREVSGVAAQQEMRHPASERELENQTYPVALGIDRLKNGDLKWTFCYAENQGGASGENTGETDEADIRFSLKADSLDEAKSKLAQMGKGVLNDSHIQVVVFGVSVLDDEEAMAALCQDWYSLKYRFGGAFCFRASNAADALEKTQENIRTYSAWKKLKEAQAQDGGASQADVFVFEILAAWQRLGGAAHEAFMREIPKLPI